MCQGIVYSVRVAARLNARFRYFDTSPVFLERFCKYKNFNWTDWYALTMPPPRETYSSAKKLSNLMLMCFVHSCNALREIVAPIFLFKRSQFPKYLFTLLTSSLNSSYIGKYPEGSTNGGRDSASRYLSDRFQVGLTVTIPPRPSQPLRSSSPFFFPSQWFFIIKGHRRC